MALVCHWHMTNSEDSQNLLGRILDFCVESMEKCIGQYGRSAIEMKKEFPGSQGAPMDRSLKEAILFSVYMGQKKTLEDACEASGHSRGSAASCLEAWVQSWWGLGCPRMLKFNFFLALPLNSQIVISLTLNHVLTGPFGLLLTPPWAGIPRSQVLPGRISRFNRDVLLSYCHQKWNHINRRFLLSQVLFG